MMMKSKLPLSLACAAMLLSAAARAEETSGDAKHTRHGPPPEAIAACSGKSAGDKVTFQGHDGNTMSGTCAQRSGEALAARPDRPPRRPEGGGASAPAQ